MKYARNVHFQIKNGKEDEFNKVFQTDVLPLLRSQTGFGGELTLLDGNRAVGISLWDNRGNAEAYEASTYRKVLERLTPVLDGAPRVETYRIGMTTLHA